MLTERRLRQVIRKIIMEVTGADAERFTAIANSAREEMGSEQEKYFDSKLGSSDKERANNIQRLQHLIMGGKDIEPKDKGAVSTLIQKALAELK
jgi:hypothetical protein